MYRGTQRIRTSTIARYWSKWTRPKHIGCAVARFCEIMFVGELGWYNKYFRTNNSGNVSSYFRSLNCTHVFYVLSTDTCNANSFVEAMYKSTLKPFERKPAFIFRVQSRSHLMASLGTISSFRRSSTLILICAVVIALIAIASIAEMFIFNLCFLAFRLFHGA